MISLYVHLPFCLKKCEYCDFESHPGRLMELDAYIDRVLGEARLSRAEYGNETLYSAYFGGGTPSLMSPEQLKRLAGGLFEIFPPEENAEITLEANPGAVSEALLRQAIASGVNRLSLGLQAAQDRLLKLLGRVHTAREAAEAVDMARSSGFQNISLDTMLALPSQTADELTRTLEYAARLGAEHISCYSLILEEGTPLYNRVRRGELTLPDEEEARFMQLSAADTLESLGYHRYEISNYAKLGRESRHNLVYWTGGEYLGLGAAAHSYMRGERFLNPNLDRYMAGQRHLERESVDAAGRLEEPLLLETRLTRGIDLNKFERAYGSEAKQKLLRRARPYAQYIVVSNDFLRFNAEGLMVHSALVAELASAF